MQRHWSQIQSTPNNSTPFKGNRKKFELWRVQSNKPEVRKWDWGGMQVQSSAFISGHCGNLKFFTLTCIGSVKSLRCHTNRTVSVFSESPSHSGQLEPDLSQVSVIGVSVIAGCPRGESWLCIMKTTQYSAKHCIFVLDWQKSKDKKCTVVLK